ncbi:hypothetical protein ETQ85_03105 [Zoogloea oleivorans]|uniref:Uncharacterized protein n=2 Tax=Zoogloea oleivorans TaxID=1552750 RepID=A0A6C2D7S2_9RHOO|nr:hypothetical protein ETQ85_03105 [Zoogloea oleivorans]
MYLPKQFAELRLEELHCIVREYHIVIARIIKSYDDGRIPHPLSPDQRPTGQSVDIGGKLQP